MIAALLGVLAFVMADTLSVGVTYEVPVYMDYTQYGEPILGGKVVSKWNPDHFTYEGVIYGPQFASKGHLVVVNEQDTISGKITLAFAGAQPLSSDSLMLTLRLIARATGEGVIHSKGSFNEFRDSVSHFFDYAITNPSNTSIEDYAVRNMEVDIFPNPASDYFTLRVPGPQIDKIYTSIYDVLGREVKRHEHRALSANSHIVFHTDDLAPGVYVIVSRVGKTQVTRKLVISR